MFERVWSILCQATGATVQHKGNKGFPSAHESVRRAQPRGTCLGPLAPIAYLLRSFGRLPAAKELTNLGCSLCDFKRLESGIIDYDTCLHFYGYILISRLWHLKWNGLSTELPRGWSIYFKWPWFQPDIDGTEWFKMRWTPYGIWRAMHRSRFHDK